MAKMFNMFDPTREGKGVSKQVGKKKRFFLFFELVWRKFFKLCGLNLIYLLCCIPLITIGPATAALMLVLRNMALERPVFIIHEFFSAFKKNFFKSLGAGIVLILGFLASGFALNFYYQAYLATANGTLQSFMGMDAYSASWVCGISTVIAFAVLFSLMFISYYVYLLIVTVDLPLKKIFKNSALLALTGLKTNILTTVFVVIICIVSFYGLLLIPINFFVGILIVFFLVAFTHFIIAFNSYQYIKKYVTDPYYKERGEEIPDDPKEHETIFND